MTTKHVMEEMSMKPDNTDTVKLLATIRLLESLKRTRAVDPDIKIYGLNLEHLSLAEFIKQIKPGNTELSPRFRGLFRWVGQSIDDQDVVETTEPIAFEKQKRRDKITGFASFALICLSGWFCFWIGGGEMFTAAAGWTAIVTLIIATVAYLFIAEVELVKEDE